METLVMNCRSKGVNEDEERRVEMRRESKRKRDRSK